MRFVLILLFCCGLASCSNELDLYSDEYTEAAVIYGIVDLAIDSQTIRVNKTFRNRESAYETLKIYDSLCFENVMVQFACYPSGKVITLNRHTRPGIGSSRHDIFSVPTSELGLHLDSILLTVINLNTGDIFSSTAALVAPPEYRGNPATIIGNMTNYIPFYPNGGSMYDAVIRLHYTEYDPEKSEDSMSRFVDFAVSEIVNPDDRFNIAFRYNGFEIITNAEALIGNTTKTRKFRGFSTFISAESADMRNFLSIHGPSPYFVQKNTFFSNIKGGIGLFTARGSNLRSNLQPNSAMEFLLKQKLNIDM